MDIFDKKHRGYFFEICEFWSFFIDIFEIKVLLKSLPQAPILGGTFKEFFKTSLNPFPFQVQELGRGD
eukprot:UN24035